MNNTLGFLKWFGVRLLFLSIFLVILLGIIAYARGYRFDVKRKSLTSTGIVSVNSNPKSAKVYVNGELYDGVTDVDLTLPNGRYTIEIKKDGYTEWKREVALKGEIVMSINALLFSKNPSLSPLTSLGLSKALPVGQTENLLLFTENDNIEKDGIYFFEGTKKAISIFPPLNPIILKKNLPEGIEISSAEVTFSPEYDQGMFTFKLGDETVSYILSLSDDNLQPQDVTLAKETIITAWEKEKNEQVIKILETFPKDIRKVATDSVQIVALAPDETKILYVAKKDVTLPRVINPPIIGVNEGEEQRDIVTNNIYVYDKKEDRNFKVPVTFKISSESSRLSATQSAVLSPTPTVLPLEEDPEATEEAQIDVLNEDVKEEVLSQLQWFPDSKHLIMRENNQIAVIEYDGSNKVIVYSAGLQNNFFASTASYNLLVIVNLNPLNNKYGDLYTIGIR
ncbi:PEGA domain-containing protein [Patescibacteria group bacterium]|nr:PEGA domain-containing protein [Patescibacteria group bacterium]